jgi:hypothetical protein
LLILGNQALRGFENTLLKSIFEYLNLILSVILDISSVVDEMVSSGKNSLVIMVVIVKRLISDQGKLTENRVVLFPCYVSLNKGFYLNKNKKACNLQGVSRTHFVSALDFKLLIYFYDVY